MVRGVSREFRDLLKDSFGFQRRPGGATGGQGSSGALQGLMEFQSVFNGISGCSGDFHRDLMALKEFSKDFQGHCRGFQGTAGQMPLKSSVISGITVDYC